MKKIVIALSIIIGFSETNCMRRSNQIKRIFCVPKNDQIRYINQDGKVIKQLPPKFRHKNQEDNSSLAISQTQYKNYPPVDWQQFNQNALALLNAQPIPYVSLPQTNQQPTPYVNPQTNQQQNFSTMTAQNDTQKTQTNQSVQKPMTQEEIQRQREERIMQQAIFTSMFEDFQSQLWDSFKEQSFNANDDTQDFF